MRLALAQAALLCSAGIAGAGEINQPVRLTALQMDKITAGTALEIGSVVKCLGQWITVTDANIDLLRGAELLGWVFLPGPQCHCNPVPPKPGPNPKLEAKLATSIQLAKLGNLNPRWQHAGLSPGKRL
jgi:hypothetical protein